MSDTDINEATQEEEKESAVRATQRSTRTVTTTKM